MAGEVDGAGARERALLLIGNSRPEEALRILSDHFDPEDPFAWWARALALMALERAQDARDAAERGLAVAPGNTLLLDALTWALLVQGDLPGAEQSALRALRQDPTNANLLARYAEVVAAAGQFDKSEQLVARALGQEPHNRHALEVHALLAGGRGDPAAMAARTSKLLRVDPEGAFAHALLAEAHGEMGQRDSQMDHIARAVSNAPANDALAELAREWRAEQHWLLWPLRPLQRFGVIPVWFGVLALVFVLAWLDYEYLLLVVGLSWFSYCVYSWTIPPLVRFILRRRRL